MSKIAIVGVEGSGKTVLMTVLGERFQTPDPYGLFLSPETRETSDFHRVNLGKLENGAWPIETPHDSVRSLRWTLQRKDGNDDNEVLADLDFLDFAGEIYREAFDGGADGADRKWAEECETLREHIRAADVLVVLVNLRNVVLRMTDERTNQVVWLSKGIVDYAKRDLKIPNVALAFTQVDAYRDVIDGAGGDLKSVLRKYLPDVSNVHSKLPLFALSAVDRTVLGADGLPRPAPGFGSQGLDDLVHWILGCTEAGKACADEIAATKARPHELWRGIVAGMEALGADAAQPAGLSAAEERCAKIAGLQAAAAELADNALRHTVKGFSDEVLSAHREVLGVWAKRAERAKAQWALVVRKRRVKACCAVAAAIFGALVVASVVAVRDHNEGVDRLVSERGYSCESSFGIKHAVWKAGVGHPKNEFLRTVESADAYESTRPGYVWVNGTATDEWTAGLVHPGNTNLVSDAAPETWKCTRRFYRWKPGTSEVEWDAGCVHPENANLVADTVTGTWKSTKPGYRWKPGTSEIEWTVGRVHPANMNLVSDSAPDTWKCTRQFYRWKRGTSEIEWDEGCVHPENADLVADATPGTWASNKSGYRWKPGTAEIEWHKGDGHPDNAWLVAGDTPDTWISTKPGYRWKSGTSQIEWVVGCVHPNCPDLKASDASGKWICTKAGYRWNGRDGIVVRSGEKVTATVKGIELTFAIENGQATVVGSSLKKGEVGVVEIPQTVDGCPVTSIGTEAFASGGLIAVTIPEGVTDIGKKSFSWQRGLTAVTIPNSVTNIGEEAFHNCDGLKSVTIPPSVTGIGHGAFMWCSGLTTVTIPSSVTSIGPFAFCGCDGLTSVTIHPGVTSIGKNAFYGCKALTSVTIPSSVMCIEPFVFEDCVALKSVTIPPRVTSIRSYAFLGCKSLSTVTIPSSVTSFATDAFKGCKVQTVYSDDPERVKRLWGDLFANADFLKSE